MSDHTRARIADLLDAEYGLLIDMSDYGNKQVEEKVAGMRSRAVAAAVLRYYADIDTTTAAASVTDGFHDNGIDAFYFDQRSDVLYFVTSKWSVGGKNGITPDAANAFVAGIRAFLQNKLERFNEKFTKRTGEILAAIQSRRHVRFEIIAAQAADAKFVAHAGRHLTEFAQELNGTVETATVHLVEQAQLYEIVTTPPKISLEIALNNWGAIAGPLVAYYGSVDAKDVATWWAQHGNALCHRNLRQFMKGTDVNQAMHSTLQNDAQNFWYFNNGITIICADVVKKALGGEKRDYGIFNCADVSVVNGAQTVGAIGGVPNAAGAQVQVRLVSLKGSPAGFDARITSATNTQNSVTRRDFAAMDPVQHRLAREFILRGREYAFKSGELSPQGDAGCDITEAAVALACKFSVGYAVSAKREIGSLWADTKSKPYTDLFSEETKSDEVWRAVQTIRAVDTALKALVGVAGIQRSDQIAVHLNRLIAHIVFVDPLYDGDDDHVVKAAMQCTGRALPLVAEYLNEVHANDYLAPLSKNAPKCEAMVAEVLKQLKATL